MFKWLQLMLGKRREVKPRAVVKRYPPVKRYEESAEPFTLRRWDAAITDRLNKAQWQHAHGQSINTDLALDRASLCARAQHEASNNPIVEGVIKTHCVDVVGREGPRLQVQSDNNRFNELVERAWRIIYETPNPERSVLGGPELMKLWISNLWTCGEYLNQEIEAERPEFPEINFGIHNIHPRRLETPPELISDSEVAFGIRFAKNKPVTYYIRADVQLGNSIPYSYTFERWSADLINHCFDSVESEQVRGFPWLSSSLPAIAALREYDKYVQEAAKNAAAQGVYWFSNHPQLEHIWNPDDTETVPIEPGMQQTGPPGWEPRMMAPTQPSAEYRPYRHERMRELGRPACMPLMVILLSSADSNFASAHYDGQVYMRAIESVQGKIERETLNHYVKLSVRQIALARLVEVPDRYALSWTWPKAPYVNPKQMYDALRSQLEDGTAAYSDALGAFGRDLEETIAKRKRENEMLDNAGLPPLPVNSGGASKLNANISMDNGNGSGNSGSNSEQPAAAN
jgi:capsid protein